MALLNLQDPNQGVLIRVQIAPTFVNCVPVIRLQLSSHYPASIWLVLLLPSSLVCANMYLSGIGL